MEMVLAACNDCSLQCFWKRRKFATKSGITSEN